MFRIVRRNVLIDANLDFHFAGILIRGKIRPRICKGNTKLRRAATSCSFMARCGETSTELSMRNVVQVRQVPAACPDYITTYAYACINNGESDRRPVKLRAYIGRESPADCFAERENRFWPLGGPWQNGFPVTISCSMKAARMVIDIRKLPEQISSNYASGAVAV